MTKNIYIIFCSLVLISCNRHQGKVLQGKGGEIESGKINVTCDKPSKTYTKELEAKVNSELGSLNNISNANLAAELKKKVTLLTQYSQKGLDRDLLLFRICQLANNRGLSNQQVTSLISEAIKIYDLENKANKVIENNGNLSMNQSGGIVNQNTFIVPKPKPRHVTKDIMEEIFKKIPLDYKVNIDFPASNSESSNFANELTESLRKAGYETTLSSYGQIVPDLETSHNIRVFQNLNNAEITIYKIK